MNKGRFTLSILTSIIFIFALAVVTQAQATRTWVSGVGDDVNPCSRTAPCKTYAGAISKTAKDGEISTLDPGGFGTLTITKSITVNGGGAGQGYGSVLSALAPQGFLVNITDPADIRKTVRLNWLDINGASSGTDGVRMIAGLALHIENTNIDGLVGDGVDINVPTGVAEVYMKNVSIRNCVGDGARFNSTGGLILATLENVQLNNMGSDGVEASARSRVTLRNCMISTMSAGAGVHTTGTADVEATIDSTTLTYSLSAVRVDIGTARVSNSVITGNSNGLHNAGGTLKTFGTNKIDGNTSNTNGVVTAIAES
jgi:hypothetical protein